MTRQFDAVLFDLDGTLVDTAPDMVRVLFDMQRAYDRVLLSYDVARASVSNGSLGLVRLAFPNFDEPRQAELQQEFLQRYEKLLSGAAVSSVLFPGLPELLDALDAHRRPWGIVTNKPQRMTDPLLVHLGLAERTGCAISGDTLPERKPNPAPLLLGCEQIGTDAAKTLYVGDARRDIEAGCAAGMTTVAATYGYITADDNPHLWGADNMAANTKELAKILCKAVNLPV
ncbi:MAG: HAD-IA family hydrolase [Gammaproteobacteria bacterium]|nr:HAD-IA family hydrolase [Gammaproteobacteria bacterium]